jgi:hypothetical protein
MIYDAYYRMTDLRSEVLEREQQPSEQIVSLKPVAGGILFFHDGASIGRMLEWDDEGDDTFIDNEEEGTLVVTTDTGSVLFTKVDSP